MVTPPPNDLDAVVNNLPRKFLTIVIEFKWNYIGPAAPLGAASENFFKNCLFLEIFNGYLNISAFLPYEFFSSYEGP